MRGRPDLAAQIPEGAGSPGLSALLIELSRSTSAIFSLGCDLGTHEERERTPITYCAGGYVQVMKAAYADTDADDYLAMARDLSANIESRSANYEWELRHVNQWVDLKLDKHAGTIPSLWTWFIARARSPDEALASREVLIAELHSALLYSAR